MTNTFLSPTDYARIQQSMPIPCIDILPLQLHPPPPRKSASSSATPPKTKPPGASSAAASSATNPSPNASPRQLHQTLGPTIRFPLDPDPQPLYIAQYVPSPRPTHEPHCIGLRQHSLALTFAIPIEGTPTAQDEALNFQWFPTNALRSPTDFGFNQDRIVATCLAKLHHAHNIPHS